MPYAFRMACLSWMPAIWGGFVFLWCILGLRPPRHRRKSHVVGSRRTLARADEVIHGDDGEG